ncbi:hypothetical protein [Streptomyces varsoviensis]|uniref:Uncharacterized protein n=1 Tax=Streptomyces varsoviensis TaxID=67373 RepID=A0ABR5J9E5_9ACTN|nr:hypothetical protein [Streptomyces varsoviensis]KOG90044.1 hypothetical protein ADK38_10890 [Streptomyces varsoviensis]
MPTKARILLATAFATATVAVGVVAVPAGSAQAAERDGKTEALAFTNPLKQAVDVGKDVREHHDLPRPVLAGAAVLVAGTGAYGALRLARRRSAR